ncbi:leucine-rich repeat protein [Bacteroides sp. AN502(2024)]|uniref:leucine-rich repeat protein n=1 Tax=Bacteroides sp. AN502(2024) TaxID=3160599 RepID=UPI00351628DA
MRKVYFNRTLSFLMWLQALCVVFTACSDGGKDEPNPTPEPSKPAIEDFKQGNLDFTEQADSKTFTFTANADWTISSAPTGGEAWCILSPASGKAGKQTVVVNVTENEGHDDRSVTVTLKAGNESKQFVVTQKQKNALLLTSDKFEVEQKGGTIQVEVKANVNYTATIGETSKEWIKEGSGTRALSTTTKVYTIAANEESEKREGTITFTDGTLTETVHVYQAGGEIILLSKDEYNVSAFGEEITVELKSNCEYKVEMPKVDWIHEKSTRALSSHTLYYTIDANSTYDSRKAEIIYFAKNNPQKADTLTIVQVQKDAIVISNKSVTVKSKGETIEVKLESNINYDMVLPNVSWIKETATRALTKSYKYLSIEENTTSKDRIAKVIFKNAENTVSDTLTITQLKYGYIKPSQNEYNVKQNGCNISINVQSNVEYEVVLSEIDWITNNSTSSSYVNLLIAPNSSIEPRTGKVILKGIEGTTAEITINQDAKSAIIAEEKQIIANAEGDTISIKIGINKEMKIEIDYSERNWISQYIPVKTKALRDTLTYFIIKPNEEYAERKGKIVFYTDGYSAYSATVKDTVEVIQKGKSNVPALVLNVEPAGSLNTLIADSRKENIKEMKLTGNLNGTDFSFMKGMSQLENLDLSEANIVEGGAAYYHSDQIGGNYAGDFVPAFDLYTKANSIVGQMFPSSLKYLVLPKSVTNITGHQVTLYDRTGNRIHGWKDTPKGTLASYVFNEYSNIQKIVLPPELTTLGSCIFYKCGELTNISLPAKLKQMGSHLFMRCSKLNLIDIPSGVTEIASNAFAESSLVEVKLPSGLTSVSDSLFFKCQELYKVTLPNNLLSIGETAFYNCKSLSSISIPTSVKTIGSGAFYGCSSLNSLSLPASITEIGFASFAFSGLQTITIPSNVTQIGRGAFLSCKQLAKISVPNNVKKIGMEAFKECDNLKQVTLPAQLDSIQAELFRGCRKLENISIPNSIKSIGESAFEDCDSIYSIIIPNSVRTIADRAFYDCFNLENIDLGTGVKFIGFSAFVYEGEKYGKQKFLINVINRALTPPAINENSFWGKVEKSTKLHIPKGTYNPYYLSEWGNAFSDIIEMEE